MRSFVGVMNLLLVLNRCLRSVNSKTRSLYVSNCSMKVVQLFSEKKATRAKAKASFFNPSVSQMKSTKQSQK